MTKFDLERFRNLAKTLRGIGVEAYWDFDEAQYPDGRYPKVDPDDIVAEVFKLFPQLLEEIERLRIKNSSLVDEYNKKHSESIQTLYDDLDQKDKEIIRLQRALKSERFKLRYDQIMRDPPMESIVRNERFSGVKSTTLNALRLMELVEEELKEEGLLIQDAGLL